MNQGYSVDRPKIAFFVLSSNQYFCHALFLYISQVLLCDALFDFTPVCFTW